ncbi:HalOD1 output domain-containing protein [Natrinema caseinilyticum]|uniref:HalOD1 output domain-containing protein n=1 Tax=Natrinema caseinilyticum TaxID=2961570 RepID=UPI0020C273D6|nr:HalOD1 output domain-containing protein [Natrinema caseinilyticum]
MYATNVTGRGAFWLVSMFNEGNTAGHGDGPPAAYREDVSLRVVRKVATELGVDPLELEPLSDTIDPEILDRLVQSRSQPNSYVAFTIEGCDVAVFSTGDITVVGPESDGRV